MNTAYHLTLHIFFIQSIHVDADNPNMLHAPPITREKKTSLAASFCPLTKEVPALAMFTPEGTQNTGWQESEASSPHFIKYLDKLDKWA